MKRPKPVPKPTIERSEWAGTPSQRRGAARGARPGARLLGPLGLPDSAAQGLIVVDEVPVHLTHLDKIYFPREGIAKRELLDYNHDVAEFLLPHLRDRPYTMKRFPDGIAGGVFFQKEAGPLPGWVKTAPMPSQGEREHINFVLCNDCATLLALVNLGCIDHNAWMSRAATPQAPDFALLDLDPGVRAPFAAVVQVARAVREVLDRFGIAGYPKTSGATGMHIWIPLAPGHTFEQSQQFSALLLRMAARRAPELATEVWSVARRPPDKVFLDFRQNGRGKTIPPPYSPRPFAGAPVSAPLHWREVKAGLDPAQFTIRTMRRRLEKWGDLFAGALPGAPAETIGAMLARVEAQAAA